MIDLYNTASDTLVGSITEAELEYLAEMLEEESSTDQDYYFEQGTLELLGTDGRATDHLLEVLKDALGSADGMELRWERR